MSLAYFTPSMNDAAVLEAIFTAREPLASKLVSRIRDSVESGNRHYMLLIGPRGIGKSHLVSLIYYRVKADPGLADKVRIAWLTEDPYSVDSYAGLLREILVQLDKEYGIPRWPEKLATIQNMGAPDAIERALQTVLLDFVQSHLLLIIAENLDTIFDSLEDTGQKKLRALLQTTNLATLLATSPSLIPAAESRDRPFFGFFRNEVLQPLTLRDCIDMLVRLANNRQDAALAQMISSPVGQARVRAIHHLAGGNPRIYVIFYQFLTRDSLDTLIEPFMKLVNELVPYYQSRMQTISPQQRRLIDTIRKHESPIAVRDIAKSMFTTSQSASSDLGKLRELGYVTATKVGRESLYELREPLMRICLATKEQRGEALPLFVEFLRLWFTPAELKGFGELSERHIPEYERYEQAIQAARQQQAAKIAFDLDRVRNYQQEGQREEATALLLDLFERAPEDLTVWWMLMAALGEQDRYRELVERAKLRTSVVPDSAAAWHDLDYVCYMILDYEAALEASTRAVELAPGVARYQESHLLNLEVLGRFVERRAAAEKILATFDNISAFDAALLTARCHDILGDQAKASAILIKELRSARAPYEGWQYLHILLDKADADQARLQLSEFATTLFPEVAAAWRDHSTALSANGLRREALAAHRKAVGMAPDKIELECEHLVLCLLAGDLAGARALAGKTEQMIDRMSPQDNDTVLFSLAILRCIEGDTARSGDLLRRYLRQVAERDQPPRDSLVQIPPMLTYDPGTLARIATLWVDTYAEVDTLAQLGKALVGSVLCPPALGEYGIDLPALIRWKTAWEPFATRPELSLPIRLMEVALRFRETQDDAALLVLPMEQRDMLRPQVERYKRFLRLASHELEAPVADLISAVRVHRLTSSPPRREPLDLDALLRNYSSDARNSNALPHLVKGNWKAISVPQARKLLVRLHWTALFGKSWSEPVEAIRILKIEAVKLTFSSALLYHAHLDIDGRSGAIDLISDGVKVAVLDGDSTGIYQFFDASARYGAEPEVDQAFVRFFCAALRPANGRFRIVDAELGLRETLAARLPTIDLPKSRTTEKDGRLIHEELMVYQDKLFQVELYRNVEADVTSVEMLSDTELTPDSLGLPVEEFIGNVRLWQPPAELPGGDMPSPVARNE